MSSKRHVIDAGVMSSRNRAVRFTLESWLRRNDISLSRKDRAIAHSPTKSGTQPVFCLTWRVASRMTRLSARRARRALRQEEQLSLMTADLRASIPRSARSTGPSKS